ncbi:glycosyltransferase [Rubrobacter taiwanensis]|jgi:N-acetylglucosaminyldiphosphoundecaprenol N-acetyl-beta-D-mannosaminyltransferase|uniref:Glycosyltransferase n=1 Tax=Rubrobacter taiwanensis TaxID=185139 RepID=A0A4R1BDU2_9ACTN|nr:WecB/TagA/CpsF family glycosyltransferase [Rubrobacter taiwanensis]TCJ15260.1 glycosyltransferase [Rubrobacter taiwanensis]
MKPPAYTLLGITVHALTLEEMILIPEIAAERDAKWVIGNHNLHSLYIYHHDATMRRFYERADYVHIDGMPLVWMGRLLGHPLTRDHRHTSIDWLPPLLERCAARGLRVFFLGSKPGVDRRAAEHFREHIPGLQLRTHHGYFDATPGGPENERVVRQINAFRPHALMVGMGMPRQERWIVQNIDRLQINAVWNLGAFMDYFAGAVPIPPRWTGRVGLEGVYRLVREPRRLWRRYVIESPFALWLLLRELARRPGST